MSLSAARPTPLARPIVRQAKPAYNSASGSAHAAAVSVHPPRVYPTTVGLHPTPAGAPPALKDRALIDRIAVLRQASIFADISEADLTAIAADCIARDFQQGEMIFNQGDPGRVLYLIAEGRVRIFVQGEEGQEKSVILYGPGDMFGDLAVIDERPRSASALVVTDTTVLMFSRENLHKHLRHCSQLALNFIKVLSVRLRYSTEQVYDLSFLDVPGRLARRLLELSERHGVSEPDGIRINFPLTQSDLAYLVGTTRESINKTLRTFRAQGFLRTQQNYVVILDAPALQKISL